MCTIFIKDFRCIKHLPLPSDLQINSGPFLHLKGRGLGKEGRKKKVICTGVGGFEPCELRVLVEVNNSNKSVSFPLEISSQ